MSIASLIDLTGSFYLEISEHEFEVQLTATTHILIGNLVAAGLLRINSQGVVGTLQMGLSVGTSSLGSSAFAITGTFQLEINSTNSAQTIQTLNVSDDGTVVGLKSGSIKAQTYRLVVGGRLELVGTFTIKGRMELEFSSDGFEITFDASLELGGFGNVAVHGGDAMTKAGSTPVFEINLGLGANAISIPAVTIEGNFLLRLTPTARSMPTYREIPTSSI